MFLFYGEMKSNNVPLPACPTLFSFSLPRALKRYAFLLYLEVHDSSPSLCLEHVLSSLVAVAALPLYRAA